MRHPAYIYGSAAVINWLFLFLFQFSAPHLTVDESTIAFISAITAMLTVLGTIIALLNQIRTGSVKDLKNLVGALEKRIEKLELVNKNLTEENIRLRKKLNSKPKKKKTRSIIK